MEKWENFLSASSSKTSTRDLIPKGNSRDWENKRRIWTKRSSLWMKLSKELKMSTLKRQTKITRKLLTWRSKWMRLKPNLSCMFSTEIERLRANSAVNRDCSTKRKLILKRGSSCLRSSSKPKTWSARESESTCKEKLTRWTQRQTSKKRSKTKELIILRKRRMRSTERKTMMIRKLQGCMLSSSKKSMKRINVLKRKKKDWRSLRERRRKRWTWKMLPDTSKGNGNGTKRKAKILPKREARRAEKAKSLRRSDIKFYRTFIIHNLYIIQV